MANTRRLLDLMGIKLPLLRAPMVGCNAATVGHR
jgi:hypothetical protein